MEGKGLPNLRGKSGKGKVNRQRERTINPTILKSAISQIKTKREGRVFFLKICFFMLQKLFFERMKKSFHLGCGSPRFHLQKPLHSFLWKPGSPILPPISFIMAAMSPCPPSQAWLSPPSQLFAPFSIRSCTISLFPPLQAL